LRGGDLPRQPQHEGGGRHAQPEGQAAAAMMALFGPGVPAVAKAKAMKASSHSVFMAP